MTYYPTYEIMDRILEKCPTGIINVYVDLKNCMTGMYMEDSVTAFLNVEKGSRQYNTDIFQSWIKYVMFLYKYFVIRQRMFRLVFFADVGKSVYHTKLFSEYKSNRSITGFKSISEFEDDVIKKTIKKNIESIMSTADRLFNTYGVYLSYLESDFIPTYMARKYFNSEHDNHVIFSSDNDMLQCLGEPNTIIYYRQGSKKKYVVDKENWWEHAKLSYPMDPRNYHFYKAVVGDRGDFVPGVPGIGKKRAESIFLNAPVMESFDDFLKHVSSIDNSVAKKILEHKDILKTSYCLVSYDELISNISSNAVNDIKHSIDAEKYDFGNSMVFLEKLINQLTGGLL